MTSIELQLEARARETVSSETAPLYDPAIDDALLRDQRDRFVQRLCRWVAWGATPTALFLFAVWFWMPKVPASLYLAIVILNLAVWGLLYPVLRKNGFTTAGAVLQVLALLGACFFCLIAMPETRLAGICGMLGTALVGNLSFSRRYVVMTSVLAILTALVGVFVSTSLPGGSLFQAKNATLMLMLNLVFTGGSLLIVSYLLQINFMDQEKFFRQSNQSRREVELRIEAEKAQHTQLEQANRQIEQRAAAEREQRQAVANILAQVRAASLLLNTTSAELLTVTTQQSASATEQSAAIAQTTTTVDEVKVIAEQAVDRAAEVEASSQSALAISCDGQTAAQETIVSMNLIKSRVEGIAENVLALAEQTQQIGEIIASVRDIASQSNMLALNASVEAARAGEHGKGFAVVAAEVRSLAEQSRLATAQIKEILSEIQKATNATVMATEEGNKGVDLGIRRVAEASQAIDKLGAAIDTNAQMARQVLAGGRQQQTGVEQIAVAMQNINQAVLENLGSTRQAERSAQDLRQLAQQLATFLE